MKKIFLILILVPFLSNCTQYSAMVGPSVTFAHSGSVLQAGNSVATSHMLKKNGF